MSVARQQCYTTGYWPVYQYVETVNEVWSRIATATHQGKLGIFAKVLLAGAGNTKIKGLRVHIYVKDFTDEADVRRVLETILSMGLELKSTPGIPGYLKPDVYLSLGISTKNEWKLKPTFYQVHELPYLLLSIFLLR